MLFRKKKVVFPEIEIDVPDIDAIVREALGHIGPDCEITVTTTKNEDTTVVQRVVKRTTFRKAE